MGRLDGKVIVVTGAGAGFGRGIVKKLTAERAKILAVDMNGDTVKRDSQRRAGGVLRRSHSGCQLRAVMEGDQGRRHFELWAVRYCCQLCRRGP